jgi:hypothetical protein
MSILSSEKNKTLIYGAVVFAAASLLYWLTVARDIVVGDSPEFITAAATLGVPHPPGYPLFTMVGHLFTLLPVGTIPFRVNLFAAICDVLTVVMIFLIAQRLTRSHLAAALAAVSLMVNPTFWSWSLVAEAFPLNNLLASILIYLLVGWHEQPQRFGLLVAAFLVMGLALTNHQTIILLSPAFCLILWQRRAALWARLRLLPVCVAAFGIGLLPYAYILWASARHPPLNWGGIHSLWGLLRLITRREYGSLHLVNTPGYSGGSVTDRIVALLDSFNPLVALLILFGLVYAYRHLRWYFWFSLLAFVFAGPFFFTITNLNLATAPSALYVFGRFFLLSQVALAPLTALGILGVVELVTFYRAKLATAALRSISAMIAIAIIATLFLNYANIDQSHNHIARSFGEDIFKTLEPGTVLLATGDSVVLPLTYLQTVEGKGNDVMLILLPLLPAEWYLKQLRERYPDLIIPFNHYNDEPDLDALLAANKGRQIAEVSAIPWVEKTLQSSYWPRQHGLVNILEPRPFNVRIGDIVKDNEQLLSRYKIPSLRTVKSKTFEKEILFMYAMPALRIGSYYEMLGAKAEARDWYQRAFAIDPNPPQPARDALARVEQ